MLIKSLRSLEILTHVGEIDSRSPGLPSWVPNWVKISGRDILANVKAQQNLSLHIGSLYPNLRYIFHPLVLVFSNFLQDVVHKNFVKACHTEPVTVGAMCLNFSERALKAPPMYPQSPVTFFNSNERTNTCRIGKTNPKIHMNETY